MSSLPDICFFDPGADIDDEVAMHYLATHHQRDMIWVVCGPNDDESIARLANYESEHRSKSIPKFCNVQLVSLPRFKDMLLTAPTQVHNVLICAPVIGYNGCNLDVQGRIFIQGSMTEKSFNIPDSSYADHVIKTISPKNVVQIPTEICAKAYPTAQSLINLPDFKKDIVFVGFKLMVGRMSPSCPFNQFAFGLVSDEFADVKKPRNLNSFREVYPLICKSKDFDQIGNNDAGEFLEHNSYAYALASQYVDDLQNSLRHMKKEIKLPDGGDIDSSIHKMKVNVARMNLAIAEMCTDNEVDRKAFWIAQKRVFYSDDMDTGCPKPLQKGLEGLVKQTEKAKGQLKFLMPFYDLVASYAMHHEKLEIGLSDLTDLWEEAFPISE